MDIISRAKHKNLVRFLGCCFTNVDSFLVYEFLPNGSLDNILFGNNFKLNLISLSRKRQMMIVMEIGN
jgi:serine/threonine protein kinase